MKTFSDLGIIPPILKALEWKGYSKPTPIQEQSIPAVLERRDLLGCAQTGTGKTAAFAIPIIQHIESNPGEYRDVKGLVVTPTRELAIQIGENFTTYSKYTDVRNTVIFGGVKQGKQTQALDKGIDVIVATPGRLLDLINQGFITLKYVEYFVLDEADHMLDMGFIHDIRKIIKLLPQKRQSLFFSATMPPAIVELSKDILGDPKKITIKPQQATAERVDHCLYFVSKADKRRLLVDLFKNNNYRSTLIFSRTKHGADKIVKLLAKSDIQASAIHGNKSQAARQRALNGFKDGKIDVLIATDIAARGIDVDELSHVINFDLPNVPETYVHRIGRTGRASASGNAISFCDVEEIPYLKDIEKLINQKIKVIEGHEYEPSFDINTKSSGKPKSNQKNRQKNGRRGRY